MIYKTDGALIGAVKEHFNEVAKYCGVDIFLLRPDPPSPDIHDTCQAERLKVHIYGDSESVEYAKTKILLMIDDIVRYSLDSTL